MSSGHHSIIVNPLPCLAFFMCLTLGFIAVGHAAEKNENPTDLELIRMANDADSYEEQYRILKPLVDKNNYKAMFRLGSLMLMSPDNNPYYDLYEGFRLLVAAAKSGEAHAQWALAVALSWDPYFSSAFKTSLKEEFRWNYAAAQQGYAPAQQDVGRVLADRRDSDYVEAYMWLTLAINRYTGTVQENTIYDEWAGFARRTCKRLVKDGYLTEKQVQEALQRVQQWEESHPEAYKVWPIKEQDY